MFEEFFSRRIQVLILRYIAVGKKSKKNIRTWMEVSNVKVMKELELTFRFGKYVLFSMILKNTLRKSF